MPNSQQSDLFARTLQLTLSDRGAGRAFLLLHGGAGPTSMSRMANALGVKGRSITPVHPDFDGTPRPPKFERIYDLVLGYLALLDAMDLSNVVVIGNSVGGWIAAEMGLRQFPRIAAQVLVNSVHRYESKRHRRVAPPQWSQVFRQRRRLDEMEGLRAHSLGRIGPVDMKTRSAKIRGC